VLLLERPEFHLEAGAISLSCRPAGYEAGGAPPGSFRKAIEIRSTGGAGVTFVAPPSNFYTVAI